MKRVLLLAIGLALPPLTSSCATSGNGGGDDVCETILLGAVLVPCVVAYGVGCVVGAGTRCCEGPAPTPDDIPEAAPSSSTSSSSELAPLAAEEHDVRY